MRRRTVRAGTVRLETVRLETVAIGALVGYAASRTMDVATTAFRARQSASSRQREEELAPGGALLQLGRQVGSALGRDPDDAGAGRIGVTIHRGFGVCYGILAATLVDRGWTPWAAGPAVAAAAFLVVDEGSALPQLTDYPLVSHLRGVVGHATFGLSAGALLHLVGRR